MPRSKLNLGIFVIYRSFGFSSQGFLLHLSDYSCFCFLVDFCYPSLSPRKISFSKFQKNINNSFKKLFIMIKLNKIGMGRIYMMELARSKEIFLKIYSNEDLANKIESYIYKHKTTVKFFLILCEKNRWEPLLKQNPMMKLSLVYAFLPTVWDRYKEKNIPEEMFWDTMSDIKIWIENYKTETNEDGLYELHWIMHHMNLSIFKIGRLQFQKLFYFFKTPYNKNGNELKFGDKILNVHIPRGAKLDFYECEKSFQMAKEFFKEFYPDFPNNKFMCHSWLLYRGNKNFMSENSNILKFQTLFDFVEEKEAPHPTYRWLFDVKIENAELMKNKKEFGSYGFTGSLKKDTELRRNAIEYIKNGGEFGEGLGVKIL